MGTGHKYTTITIKVGGETQSVEYYWKLGASERCLVLRREDGTETILNDPPQHCKTDYASTISIVENWAAETRSAKKFVFKQALKDE